MKKGKTFMVIGILAFLMLPNYVKADEIDVCASCEITNLEEAIENANDGDVINLKEETYEVGHVSLKKELTINGSSVNGTILKLNEDAAQWLIVANGYKVNLNNLTLDGAEHATSSGIEIQQNGTLNLNNAIIKNIACPSDNSVCLSDYPGAGIINYGSLNAKNVKMSGIKNIGIYIRGTDSMINAPIAIIDNFEFVGNGLSNDVIQLGIKAYNNCKLSVSNTNITGCYAKIDGLVSCAINIYNEYLNEQKERIACHEEILEKYNTFTTPRCSEVTDIYIETSDLTDNDNSIYIGSKAYSGNVVVRYSKLGNYYARHNSYADLMYNYWEDASSLDEVVNKKVGFKDENPTIIYNINTNGFYTSASAAISKSPILDFSLKQDNVEFSIGKSYLLDDYVNVNQNMFNDVTLDTPSATEDFRLHVWDYVKATPKDSNVLTVDNETGKVNLSALKEGATTIAFDTKGFNPLVIGVNVLGGNPQTSDLPIVVICFVGLIALGYGIYKLNKSKYDY